MKKLINMFIYLSVLALSVLFIYYGNQYINNKDIKQRLICDREVELDALVYAKIISIDNIKEDKSNPIYKDIAFTATLLDNDDVVKGHQVINKDSRNLSPISIDDKVTLLSYGNDNYLFQYYYRFDKVIILGVVIAGIILLMGGIKGFNTIISLSLTCLSIFLVFIPSIKAGFNIYLSTIIICLYIITMTLIIVYGLSKKSIITAFSCAAGVIFSGVLSFFMDKWMKLTGFINDDTYLLSSLFGIDVDVKAIAFSMITIGALGAIMDVAMSVISPLCELKETGKSTSSSELIKMGLSMGKDFMGTMTNTLILAYIGSSLIVVLVYAASDYPLLSILNKEEIIFEFLQSMIGCMGILFTIPFATIVSSFILSGDNNKVTYNARNRRR